MFMIEEWKKIGRWPEYSISNMGRIMKIVDSRSMKAGIPTFGRLKKGCYPDILLSNGKNKCEQVHIHVLVLETFVGLRPKDHIARHLNDIKDDNRLSNLKWGTYQENIDDRRKNGIAIGVDGWSFEDLSERQSAYIRERRKKGLPLGYNQMSEEKKLIRNAKISAQRKSALLLTNYQERSLIAKKNSDIRRKNGTKFGMQSLSLEERCLSRIKAKETIKQRIESGFYRFDEKRNRWLKK